MNVAPIVFWRQKREFRYLIGHISSISAQLMRQWARAALCGYAPEASFWPREISSLCRASLSWSLMSIMEDSTKIAVPQASSLPPIGAVASAPLVGVVPAPAASAGPPSGANFVTSLLSSQFSAWRDERLKTFRPISEFTDKTRFALPPPTQIYSRLKTNLYYFQSNYVAVFVLLALYCACVLNSASIVFPTFGLFSSAGSFLPV